MNYSLRHPPEGLCLLHVLLWPWIYAQIIALRLLVRKHYGSGVPYRFEVSPLGRVRLLYLPTDITWGHAANAPLLEAGFDFTTGVPRPALTRAPRRRWSVQERSARMRGTSQARSAPCSSPRSSIPPSAPFKP